MAEWKDSSTYSPGDIVTYEGLTYVRSSYPPTPTGGTNPKEELSTDPKGNSIRTWELRVASPASVARSPLTPYNVGYFALKAPIFSDGLYAKDPPLEPPIYPGKSAPNSWAGPTQEQASAYFMSTFDEVPYGTAVEMDQARTAEPLVDAMPAASCGVAMQQYQAPTGIPLNIKFAGATTGVLVAENLVYDPEEGRWVEDFGALPRVYYVFLLFNHPLYFRRSHTISFRISTYNYAEGYEIPLEPPDPPIIVPGTFDATYSTTSQVVIPTDNNYMVQLDDDFISPSNAVCTFTLTNNSTSPGPYGSTTGTNYDLVAVYVSDVEEND